MVAHGVSLVFDIQDQKYKLASFENKPEWDWGGGGAVYGSRYLDGSSRTFKGTVSRDGFGFF
jgi:hypothetical protein